MDQTDIIEVVQEAILLAIQIGAPPMLIGLAVGVTIALFQALTQVQEMTLTFVPKIFVMGVVMIMTLPMMGQALSTFMAEISARVVGW